MRTLAGTDRTPKWVAVVHIKTTRKLYKHRLTVLQLTINVMRLAMVKSLFVAGFVTNFDTFPQKITKIFCSVQ